MAQEVGSAPPFEASREPAAADAAGEPTGAAAWVAHLAFPVVTAAAIGFAIHQVESGTSPFLAMVQAQVPAFLVVIGLERLFPYHRDWNRSHDDFWVDLRHGVTITVFGIAIAPAIAALALWILSWLTGVIGSPLWPADWPLAFQLALALVAGELGQYWVHRLQHEKDWLWRFHALHHSAPRLYWLNASRFHFVDIGLNALGGNLVLLALGATTEVLMLWILFSAIHGIFQHANIPVRIGPLNWIFSMAELHRWHHSRLVAESNTNYGQNLAVWDVVFGTRFLPKDRQPPRDIGLAELPAFPMTWWAQIRSPFEWSRIKAENARLLGAGADGGER